MVNNMVGLKQPKILSETNCKEFERYYDGNLSVITSDSINSVANEMFEGWSGRFILPQEYHPQNFHQYFNITHNRHPKEITFVAHQTKVYDSEKLSEAERLVYLVDILGGEHIGHGEIRFKFDSRHPFFTSKPFVGYTCTEKQFRRRGYGTRRLSIMNALTRVLFQFSLHSDKFSHNHPKMSEGPWKRHLLNGAVVPYGYGGGHRYYFI